MPRPPVISRATGLSFSVMNCLNPRVVAVQRLRDSGQIGAVGVATGVEGGSRAGVSPPFRPDGREAKPLQELAIETKTPPDLSAGVSR